MSNYRNKKLTQSARHESCVSCGVDDRVKVGDRFNRLVVIELIPHSKNPKAKCLCDCGNIVTPQRGALKNERAKSCGCLRTELLAASVDLRRLPAEVKKLNDAKSSRKWQLAHPERCRELNRTATRKFYKLHPEKAKENCQKRRARKLNAMGVITKGIETILLKKQKNKCACCKADLNNKWHLDHVTPLVVGGLHDDNNLQILCVFCNLSKGSKDPINFMQERGYLL